MVHSGRMLPSSTDLHYFLAVAQTLNITQAAKRLGLSQPSLTAAIQRLEQTLGAPLLQRTRLGCHLTRSGHKLVPQARALLEDWDKIRLSADRDEREVRGRFKIGCHTSVGMYSLHIFTAHVMKKHPHLELTLVNDLSRRIVDEVLNFRIDFGIAVNPVRHQDLVIRPLVRDSVTFWVGPKPSTLVDFEKGAVLIYDPHVLQSLAVIKQWSRYGAPFARTIECGSLEIVAKLVGSGAGIGILPGRVVANQSHLRLKILSDDAPRFDDQLCLVARVETLRSKGAKELMTDIEHSLKTSWAEP